MSDDPKITAPPPAIAPLKNVPSGTGTLSLRELFVAIEAYDFVETMGHPLKNCAEWVELRRRLDLLI